VDAVTCATPLERVRRAFAFLTRTHHGSRLTGDEVSTAFRRAFDKALAFLH
jgi:hypothetical protein